MNADSPATVTLTVEKPVYGGDFLAHVPGSNGKPGKAVFVPFTLPGEQVTAQLTEEKKTFAKAEVQQLLAASPNRVAPRCRHFGICGGCQYQHADYETQLALKEQVLRETLSRAGVAVPVKIGRLAGDPWEYRNRIRLALVSGIDGLKMGYRGRASHTIMPIVECPIAAPGLLQAAEAVRHFLSEKNAPVVVSEVELFTNHDGSGLLVTLFCETAEQHSGIEDWLQDLLGRLPHGAGLKLQVADGSLNPRLLGSAGATELQYRAADVQYTVEHGAFFQVNRHLVNGLLDLVTSGRSGQSAWDLFAGVGLFAGQLANVFQSAAAVESAPASISALKRNLSGGNGRVVAATTIEFLKRNRAEREPGPDLIILDPPRAGLGDQVTSLLNAIGAPSMVYVSCDPATLARDLQKLTAERYRINRLTLVDMFPQTFHIETVAELSRV